MTNSKPLRVLHIAFTMHARGTETWLMSLMRRMDPSRVQMDFVTTQGEKGVYDTEIKKLGGTLHACPHPSKRGAFLRAFRKVLKDHGPYDIVHGHPYGFNGLLMLQAARMGVPVRITHSHTDRRKVRRDKSPRRNFYHWLMKYLIKRLSTHGLAASKSAATALFGKSWKRDKRWQIMHCGVDLELFKNLRPANEIKEEMNIPPKSQIIGHVGGFHFEKNHDFLIRVFARMTEKNSNIVLLLVGDGPLLENMKSLTRDLGIENRVIFTGTRTDIADLLSIMDVFVFPSLFEGLGLAVVEAQAADLPCLVADNLPEEAAIIDRLVNFIPLIEDESDEVDLWAGAVQNALSERRMNRAEALKIIEASDFNIEHNVKNLTELYERLVKEAQK
ncbi:MAG: glycosyltransferase family 1 protein [Alphaproteobacteria bacterium]|nr:glycosyltransferase family 1 protein [Alphaproteobacteria bacterium]